MSDLRCPSALEEFKNLPRPRMSLRLGLLEERTAVTVHLESPATRGDELTLGVWVLGANLGRQTDGPWFVISDLAELDRDLHRDVSGCSGS